MAFYGVSNLKYPAETTTLYASETYTVSFDVPYEMLDVDWNPASDNVIRLYVIRANGTAVIKEQVVTSGGNIFSFRLADYDLQDSGVTGILVQISAYILIDGKLYSLFLFGGEDSADNNLEYGAPVFITRVGAPGVPQLSADVSREGVALTWSAGADGTGNTVTGYDVEMSDSADGLAWGAWQTAPGTPVTGTSATVYPPAAAGYYRRFRVRTRGTAGGDWYSEWVQSAGALRRKWDAFGAWTDATLTAGVSGIRAVHLTQMHERVNTIRAFYDMGAYAFTPVTARKTKIAKWVQLISEIRTAIDQITTDHDAYNALSEGRPRIANVTQLRRIIDEM